MGYPNKPRNEYERARMRAALDVSRPLRPTIKRKRKTKIDWPSDNTLEYLLRSKSRETVGEMIGVSGNAVKKRCSTRNIPEPISLKGRQRPRPRIVKTTPEPTDYERAEARRAKSLLRLAELHGTRRGYLLEGRLKVERCDKCRAANTEYQAKFNARTKKARPVTT